MSAHRTLTDHEREQITTTRRVLDGLRPAVVALASADELAAFDDASEVLRAIATDTRSLVRSR